MGSTDVVPAGTFPAGNEWERMKEMAKIISNTEFVPKGLRGRPDAVLAALVAGRELGIGPMQALQGISILDGRVNYGGELLTALIRKAGHSMTFTERTDTVCTVKGKRADSGDELEVTWTLEDAKAAGLAGRRNWQQYPRTMLQWRCVTELSRSLFADVTIGLASYTDEELGSEEPLPTPPAGVNVETGEIVEEAELVADEDTEPVDVEPEPEPEKPKRKRRTKAEMEAARAEQDQAADRRVDDATEAGLSKLQAEAERIAEEVFAPLDGEQETLETLPDRPEHVQAVYDAINLVGQFRDEWNEENVLVMANQSFKPRTLSSLDDLTEEEAARILAVADSHLAEVGVSRG